MNESLYCRWCKKETPQMSFLTGTVCTVCKGTNPIEHREPDAAVRDGAIQRGTHEG